MAGELLCPLLPRRGGGGCEGVRGRGRGGHTLGCLAASCRAEFQRSQLVLVPGRRLGKRENVCARAPPGSQARWRGTWVGAGGEGGGDPEWRWAWSLIPVVGVTLCGVGCGIGWGDAWGEDEVEVCTPVGEGVEEGRLEERETAGNPSLFSVLELKVLRNNVLCS